MSSVPAIRNNAAEVASQLAETFLTEGNYDAAGSMRGTSLALSFTNSIQPLFEDGFAGLSVQAVGFEDGAENPRVHVYVTKGAAKKVKSISTKDGDVEIVVNRLGKALIRPEKSSSSTHRGSVYTRNGRICCGSSCAPSKEQYSGTFGAIVKRGKDIFALSNNHVFGACNHTPIGMPILSPSAADATPNGVPPTHIANHAEICELRSGEPRLVPPCLEDVALAQISDPSKVSSWQGDLSHGYDTPSKVIDPIFNLAVKKFGRTTDLTFGRVEARLNTFAPVEYKTKNFTAVVWFRNVWTIIGEDKDDFAMPGDSGSLVVTADGSATVGIVFAGFDRYAYMIPFSHASTCFGGIKLVSGHGL